MASYRQRFPYSCPNCRHDGEEDVWLVVDIAERPDLAEEVRGGRIRAYKCTVCAQPVTIDASLLVARPQGPQAVLFAPARSADQGETDEQFRFSLLLMMRGWTGQRPVPRDELFFLPIEVVDVAVDRDIIADLDERAGRRFRATTAQLQRYADWLDDELRARRGRRLIPVLVRLLESDDLDSWRRIIESEPMLLDEEVDVLLADMGPDLVREHPEALPVLEHRRTLLRQCREHGVERVFSGKLPIGPDARETETGRPFSPQIMAAVLRLAGKAPDGYPELRTALEAALQSMSEEEARLAIDGEGELLPLRPLFTRELARAILACPLHAADLREAARMLAAAEPEFASAPRAQADTLHLLGVVHRALGDREASRAAFARVLLLRTRETDAEGWAAATADLASTLSQLARADERSVLDEAIGLLQSALDDPRVSVSARTRAVLRAVLGSALVKRGHVDQGLELLSAVESDPSLADDSVLLAQVRTNLGLALGMRAEGSGSAADWERARDLLRAAVNGTDPDQDPYTWLAAITNVGIVLFRNTGNPALASDLDEAVALYEHAVEVADRFGAWGQQASMLNNLGNALMERPGGDREEDVSRAIAAYERARQLWTRDEFPQEWALTTARLARAVRERGRDAAPDLRRAARLYDDALAVLDREMDPVMWLRVSGQRGALRDETEGGNADMEVELALREVGLHDRANSPLAWARAQHDLGLAYHTRALRTDSAEDLQLAAEAFLAALDTRPQSTAPVEWAQTAACLGMTKWAMDETALAEAWLRQAVEVLESGGPVRDVLRIAPNLALLLAGQARWADAVPVFRIALDALARGFASGVLRTAREDILGRYGWLNTSAAFAMAAAGLPQEAVATLERGRARLLTETLRRHGLANRPAGSAQAAAYSAFDAAAAALARAEDASNRLAAERRQHSGDELYHARAQADVRAELRAAREAFDHALRELPAEEVTTAPPDQPLVYFVADSHTTPLALIVTSQGIEPVTGSLSSTELQDMLRDLFDAQQGNHARLDGVLDTTGRKLGDDLVGAVAERLRAHRATAVTLVPCGLLSAFPLHAASYGDKDDRRVLLDEFTITYAPSGTVHARALAAARERRRARVTALVVTDPEAGLEGPGAEAEPLRGAAESTCDLAGTDAPAVLAAGATATHLHFGGHARTLPDNPLHSHLRLGPDRRLTLLDLLAGTSWPRMRLVVASACETAMTDGENIPDEVVGLPAGFLAMGVPAFLGTLWATDDFPSALLTTRFYELTLHDEGPPAPEALRCAQLWLRSLDGDGIARYLEEHPALATGTRLALARDYPQHLFFADTSVWAAHVFIGTA